MSADIATLALAVDSTQVAKAKSVLDSLASSAKPAEAATRSLANAHGGLSTQAMAAQHSIRSALESIASGMPLTQALGLQINHLSYAASGPGGLSASFKAAATSVLGLMSPTTAVAVGLAAVAGGAALAVSEIAKTEKAFDDTAHAAGTTIGELHALESAASFKGIDTNDFLKAMTQFGQSVYQAKANMGGLAEVFRVNNVSAQSFSDYVSKAADLIKNATSDQQRLALLQQMGLPATMEWVRFLSQGADGTKAAVDQATKFGSTADEALVAKARAFDEAWNTATKNLGTGLRNAAVEGASWLDTLGSKANALLMKLPGIGQSVPTNILRYSMVNSAAGYSVGSKLTGSSNVDQFYQGIGGALGGANGGGSIDKDALKSALGLEQPRIGLLAPTNFVRLETNNKSTSDKDRNNDSDQHRRAA